MASLYEILHFLNWNILLKVETDFENISEKISKMSIERQLLFCKATFLIGKDNIFFGMCSSVNFAPRSLASADSPKKFFLLFLALGNAILGNTKVYCLEYL